jgi:mono/diheme cytochrome c family protein
MRTIILIAISVVMLTSCYNDKFDKLYPAPVTVICDTTAVSYQHTIAPIIAQNCATSGCHDGNTRGADNLSTYTALNADASKLSSYIVSGSSDPMPKNGAPLTSCQISQILAWVNQGAINN